jgi:serine/threonine protein kinase
MLKGLLESNPDKRLSLTNALEHPWLTKYHIITKDDVSSEM